MVPVAVAEPHHFVVAGTEGADAEPDLTLHGIAITKNHSIKDSYNHVKRIRSHSLGERLLGLLELGTAEGPVHAGEGASLGIAVVTLNRVKYM